MNTEHIPMKEIRNVRTEELEETNSIASKLHANENGSSFPLTYNDDLYKDQVEKIPVSFRSVEQYFQSFLLPLLEETRAAMCSSMEVIDRAPYAEVTCLNEAMSHGRTLLFDVNVDYWRNRFGVREKKPYKILPGDVFVIADLKPETASDLQRVGRNWTFALLTNVRNDDDEYDNEEKSSFTSFRVKTLADNISKYEMRYSEEKLGGKRSSKQKAFSETNMGFIDMVFRWSVEDIFNDSLYKDQGVKLQLRSQLAIGIDGCYYGHCDAQSQRKMGDKGSSEQRVWTKKADMDFIDIVFRWSLEDIFNENLYKDQVKKIPVSFQSVDQYFESYVLPLLDEIRVEMQSSMETIARAPYAEVTNLDVASCVPFSFAVNVDYWRKRSSTPDKKPYKTLPGDVLVIADVKPETASDLVSSGTAWTFALVTKIKDGNGNNSSSTSFKLTTLKDFRSKDDKKKSLYVIHLMSLITNRRLWNALHMRRNLKIINEVLCTDQKVAKGCCLCSSEIGGDWNNIFLKILLSQLNDSQKNSVVACLNKMQCNHKSHVELIWGPPGTGKTRTVSVLLFSLLRMKYRTLTCAPTNVAIADLAARVVKLVKESIKTGSVADGQFCSLGDILLFGNKQRLKVDFKIEEIFLDYRVDRLSECFGLLGWRHCFTSMTNLLEDCVSPYHIFLENETSKEKKGGVAAKMIVRRFSEEVVELVLRSIDDKLLPKISVINHTCFA
ncbi:hypothetical protein V6N13_105454 [Hibiscus sabdariffa]